MKIAIIGAGNVGKTLGTALRSKGHTVVYGSRNPAGHTAGNVKSVADALVGAEAVILATPWTATEALVVQHADGLANKIVIDATNPIHPSLARLAIASNSSGVELLQSQARQAKFFKAFNSTGANVMAHPRFAAGQAAMFVAGPDGADKDTVLRIVADVGFEPVDAGETESCTSAGAFGDAVDSACAAPRDMVAISPSSSRGAKMPRTAMPSRALGWLIPNPKRRSSYGYPCSVKGHTQDPAYAAKAAKAELAPWSIDAARARPARRADRHSLLRRLPLRHPPGARRVEQLDLSRWCRATRSSAASPRSATSQEMEAGRHRRRRLLRRFLPPTAKPAAPARSNIASGHDAHL